MKEGAKLHNHLAEFNILMAQLVNVGDKLDGKEKVILLPRSLSKSYKPLA